MNRRRFIKTLVGAAAATVAAPYLPKASGKVFGSFSDMRRGDVLTFEGLSTPDGYPMYFVVRDVADDGVALHPAVILKGRYTNAVLDRRRFRFVAKWVGGDKYFKLNESALMFIGDV